MVFKTGLSKETCEYLENEYREYVTVTPMTKKERRALLQWVKDGNSVHENSSGVWYDGQVPADFLTVYRDEEYIRQHTVGMSAEETRKFAMSYYGWDEDDIPFGAHEERVADEFLTDSDTELSF